MTTFYDLPTPSDSALKRSKALTDFLRQEMNKHGGYLSFATFMQQALYHSELGYYNSETLILGKHGDFTTAPEISPLFAKCFAKQCLQIANHLGTAAILELGAGSGRFAKELLLELERHPQRYRCLPEHYYIYEISVSLRKKQQDLLKSDCPTLFNRIIWLDELPSHFVGIVIANEVLDALPVHCFGIKENAIKERAVTFEKNTFHWTLTEPFSPNLAISGDTVRQLYSLTNGYESEINLALPLFIQSVATSLAQGVILFADYGYGQSEYYHPERRHGTLTCFYQHHRSDNPFFFPGLQDITAHVDFTRVIETAVDCGCSLAGYTSQAAFLLACGLIELAQKDEQNLAPADEFNFHQAIKLLTLPTEMGERIKVMALSKNCDIPLLGFGLQDRRRDL
jgi:SAM-dependent MidA family methyltransferase